MALSLLNYLKTEAVCRNLFSPAGEIDAAAAFALVRDMPYRRASDRRPETIIREWRGTCSGKHYLLQALFAELDLVSQVMACTAITPVDADQIPEALQPLYEAAHRRFVDVHNYLLVSLPDGGEMKVDATWPLAARKAGMIANEAFILGQDQQLAYTPLECWPVPKGREPQDFKDELLQAYFTPEELAFREVIIRAMSERTAAG